MVFRDRKDAGRMLAERLSAYRGGGDVVVLGLPRGGVVIAAEIASALRCPMDVLIVRKLGTPGNPELATGALSETGARVLNEDVVSAYAVGEQYLRQETARQQEEIRRRRELYRGGRPIIPLAGKTVILADDGVATGATFKAAVAALKAEHLDKLVAAVPVAPPSTAAEIVPTVDEWICLNTPSWFMAVGAFYAQFDQVEDDEVLALLDEQRKKGSQ